MTVLDAGRIGIATQALGIAEAAYEAARQYAVQREAFGQPIGGFQGTGFKVADMKTRIEASRLLIYNAALAKEKSKKDGSRYSLEASMAKLFAIRNRHVRHPSSRSNPWRHGLQQGIAGRALFPRREDHRNLRRDK